MKTSITIIILIFSQLPGLSQNEWEVINTDITEPLHDIEFVNDNVGFIYSYGTGNIYKTIDEGNTWKRIKQTDSIYFEQLQFVNSKLGWICGEKGKLLRTQDCGTTWTDLSITVNDKNLLLYGMCFINDSTGYLSGAVMYNRKFEPKLYVTNDCGITWTAIFEDIPHMILNLEEKDNELFATGNGFIVRIGIQTNTWKYAFRDTLRIIGQIRDIQFADDKLGIGISFNGKILITTNGGDSFSYKEITTNRLRSIAYLGGEKWIVAGDNNKNDGAVLYSSSDNGENWEKCNDFPDIHRITTTDKNIWIVGKNGLIAKMKK
jgi:photosystem II stability/assembly factor-like uncharacterized protein